MFKKGFLHDRGDSGRWKVFLTIGILLVILSLVLSACAADETPEPTEPPPPEPTEVPPTEVPPTPTEVPPTPTEVPPTPTPLPDQSAYLAAWEGSTHSLFDDGHGPNTWCARCHSPQNWDPEAFQGPPPACFSCKFPTDEEVRDAPGNPYVPEEEWFAIPCETCHMVDENGIASEEIAWLNPVSMEYVSVSTPTELCEKCHVTTTGNAFGSAVDHKITLGGSAHLNYGGFLGEVTPPQYCTDCHDPHSQEPLMCEDCHADVLTLDTHIKGMSFHLEKITCMACHDATGLDVGPHPSEEGGMWVTQQTTMGRGGPSTDYVLSHSPVFEVACDRCHFEENPWELTV
jgi:hypothetical protein